MERNIIIGYDPKHGGSDALHLGRLLAGVLDAKPIVMTALLWPDYMLPPADLQSQVDAEMRSTFSVIREDLRDLEVETRSLASRSPAAALQETAETERASLIVIGPCHRSEIGRTLLGSVGESLMHGAPCAIAVAPPGYADQEQPRLNRLAVAFDGSPESWSALETGFGLAERCHGNLTVIAVADFPRSWASDIAWSGLSAPEIEDAVQEEKEGLLEVALASAPDGLSCVGRLLTGSVGPLLAEATNEFDVMITGSRAYGPLRRTVLGSATRQLIRSSSCPVLVLPRAVGVDPLGVRAHVATSVNVLDEAPRSSRPLG